MTAMRRRPSGPGRGDLLAGVGVAFVLAPQALAYAQLAGLPPEHGLYAAVAAPLAASLLGSSPYLQTGPVALTSLLTLGAVESQAQVGTADFAAHAALLALVVGVVRVVLGLLRAGMVGYLLSEPAVAGFTSGAAVLIVSSQLPTLLGVDVSASNPLWAALAALVDPGRWNLAAAALGLAVVAAVRLGRRVHPLFPGVLLATAAALVLNRLAGPFGATVSALSITVPDLPPSLPWGSLPELVLPGTIIAVVGFAEPASIARRYATLDRQRWEPDRELVAQGAANLASGLVGGLPTGGSFSRTALNRLAGATSRWSGAVTGLTVLLLLPLAPVLSHLPRAALAGLIVAPTLSLIDAGAVARYWRWSPVQAGVAVGTFVATLALAPHLERAVLVGVALALAVHLWRELHLPVRVELDGSTVRLYPHGVLYFASAPGLEDRLITVLAQHPDVERVVISLGGLGRADLSGMLTLRSLLTTLAERFDVVVEDVPPPATRLVERTLRDLDGVRVSPDPARTETETETDGTGARTSDSSV